MAHGAQGTSTAPSHRSSSYTNDMLSMSLTL